MKEEENRDAVKKVNDKEKWERGGEDMWGNRQERERKIRTNDMEEEKEEKRTTRK